MVTDRHRNIYEGAAGKRRLDRDGAMTTDTVFALFSTTKAITGTAVLQLVEEGKLDLDAPAKTYAPDIGKLQVIEGFDAAGEPKLRASVRRAARARLRLRAGDATAASCGRWRSTARSGARPARSTSRRSTSAWASTSTT